MTPAGQRPLSGTARLSDRERELLPLLAGILSQREIGAVLHLSLNTVKTHSRVLYRKLGASSRAEAVQRARQMGWRDAADTAPAPSNNAHPSSSHPGESPPGY